MGLLKAANGGGMLALILPDKMPNLPGYGAAIQGGTRAEIFE